MTSSCELLLEKRTSSFDPWMWMPAIVSQLSDFLRCRYACELGRGWFPASLRCWLDPLARGKLHGTAGGSLGSLELDPNLVEAQNYVLKWFWLIRGSSQKRTWCHSVRWCYWLQLRGLFYVVLKTKHLNWIRGLGCFFGKTKMTLEDVSLYLLQMGARTSKTSRQVRKIMSFFVSIFFSFEQLFEIFWKTSGAWRPRSSAAIRTQRRWWLDLRSDGPKHCRHVFEDCCGSCRLSNLEIFQWTFGTAPFG